MKHNVQHYFKSRSFSKRKKKHFLAERIFHMRNLSDFAYAAAMPVFKLRLLALEPHYHTFFIPKPGKREKRLIEAPAEPLKSVLSKLNRYLQAAYYKIKTRAAYGYVINHKKEKAPRNILSNARSHIRSNYMLNIDLLDFFHQVTTRKVEQVFLSYPFSFEASFARFLSQLCTFRGRLTMGSPASPALSNFACIALDRQLIRWADRKQIKFTRFVDDLTFSSDRKLTDLHLREIKDILFEHRFLINPKKIRFFDKNTPKEVTGLILQNDRVEIPPRFLQELEEDLKRLKNFNEVLFMSGEDIPNIESLQKFEQGVAGKINFIGFVYGYRDPLYTHYLARFEKAFDMDRELLSRSWLDFPYAFTIH